MKTLKMIASILVTLTMLLSCTAFAEEPATPALLAYYTFDDAENLGIDASGSGNDLVRAINPDGISAVEGFANGAVYFGGESGLIAKDEANDDFIDTYTGKSLTVSFYAKVDIEKARTGNSRVVDTGINGSDEGFTMLVSKSVADDGTVSLATISKVGASDWWGSYGAVTENVDGWHQYVMVYDSENCLVTAFIDGVKVAEVYADEDEKLAGGFTFCVGGNWAQWDWFNGGNGNVVSEGFAGAVDEVKVFAGACYDIEAINAAK